MEGRKEMSDFRGTQKNEGLLPDKRLTDFKGNWEQYKLYLFECGMLSHKITAGNIPNPSKKTQLSIFAGSPHSFAGKDWSNYTQEDKKSLAAWLPELERIKGKQAVKDYKQYLNKYCYVLFKENF